MTPFELGSEKAFTSIFVSSEELARTKTEWPRSLSRKIRFPLDLFSNIFVRLLFVRRIDHFKQSGQIIHKI